MTSIFFVKEKSRIFLLKKFGMTTQNSSDTKMICILIYLTTETYYTVSSASKYRRRFARETAGERSNPLYSRPSNTFLLEKEKRKASSTTAFLKKKKFELYNSAISTFE